jgi:hypothetical protein
MGVEESKGVEGVLASNFACAFPLAMFGLTNEVPRENTTQCIYRSAYICRYYYPIRIGVPASQKHLVAW